MNSVKNSVKKFLQINQKLLTKAEPMIYNITRARKIPRQLYFSTIYNWREVRCESMSNVIVKENETLDSALRRFKRSCAKAGIQQEIRKESITRNQAFVVRKNLKPQENVNIINCAQKSLTIPSGIFKILHCYFINKIKMICKQNENQR